MTEAELQEVERKLNADAMDEDGMRDARQRGIATRGMPARDDWWCSDEATLKLKPSHVRALIAEVRRLQNAITDARQEPRYEVAFERLIANLKRQP